MINQVDNRRNILIVDDSESFRAMISFYLGKTGHNILTASNGMEALNNLQGKELDLVITDLHMPQMDGLTFIKMIRNIEHYKSVPILFLTTESNVNLKKKAKQAGANGWLVKPVVEGKLLDVVNKVISQ